MSTTTARSERLLTRPFLILAVAELAYFTADGVSIYALPVYATGPVGAGEAGAGAAFGAFAVSALLLRPFMGRLCDSWGRRPVLLLGCLVAAAGTVATAAVGDLTSVVALRLVLGVAEAAFFVATFAAVADLAPPSRLGEALSYSSLGLYLGLAVGPPLGEALVERGGFTVAWLGGGALAALAGAAVLALPETADAGADAEGSHPLIHRPSVPVALVLVTLLVAMGGFLSLAVLRAHAVGLVDASLPLFVYGAVVVGCRLVFARVPDRLPPLALGAAALALVAAGLLVMAAWGTPTGLLAGVAVMALGVTFSTPALMSAVFATARPSERGAASGTASAAMDLGLGGGPIALGLLAQATGIPAALSAAAGIALVGSWWALRLARRG
jgi:predicted MFS family arabinose efflux permease